MTTTIGSLDLTSQSALYDETQYFWFESSSSSAWGAGAHVTLYPESEFTNSSSTNYLKGQNILMNTDGLSIRNGVLPMMTLDNNSLDFNVIDLTNGTYKTTATFSATSAQIGQSDAAHSIIDVNGQRFYGGDGTDLLAHIGYGSTLGEGQVTNAAYYTFGSRKANAILYDDTRTYIVGDLCIYNNKIFVCIQAISTPESFNSSHWQLAVGALSFSQGGYAIASGDCSFASGFNSVAIGCFSHVEGNSTIALGDESHAEGNNSHAEGNNSHAEGGSTAVGIYSHAEGYHTHAEGNYSHAEGRNTAAEGKYSHTEGYNTTAEEDCSHAEGYGTVAGGKYAHAEGYNTTVLASYGHAGGIGTTAAHNQMAIGSYNIVDSNLEYAFIIGNGSKQSDTITRSNAFMVDKDGYVYPQATKMTDFITEQGVLSNVWRYRKWNSGIIEAWGMTSWSNVSVSRQNSMLYKSEQTVTIPTGIFSTAPNYVVTTLNTGTSTANVHASARIASATSLLVTLWRNGSGSITGDQTFYVVYNPIGSGSLA